MYYHVINWILKFNGSRTWRENVLFYLSKVILQSFAIFMNYLHLMRHFLNWLHLNLLCVYQNHNVSLFKDHSFVFRNLPVLKFTFGHKLLPHSSFPLPPRSAVFPVTRKLRPAQDRSVTPKLSGIDWFMFSLFGKLMFLVCSSLLTMLGSARKCTTFSTMPKWLLVSRDISLYSLIYACRYDFIYCNFLTVTPVICFFSSFLFSLSNVSSASLSSFNPNIMPLIKRSDYQN